MRRALHDLSIRGVDVGEALRLITTSDVRWGCDVLRPAYDASNTVDGRVSIEVDPRISGDAEKTIAEARSLWWMVDRPNLFIKIPATSASLPAISQALAEGISVNVTLIFSLDRYGAGDRRLLRRSRAGTRRRARPRTQSARSPRSSSPGSTPRSTSVSTRSARRRPPRCKGKAAVANARLAYQLYEEKFAAQRWASLAASGAKAQRPLWASTGVKDPAYDDTMYVVDLVADHTVNTMPEPTLQAVHDHGVIDRRHDPTVTMRDAQGVLDNLAAVGIDYDDVVLTLEREGVEKFEASWADLIAASSEGTRSEGRKLTGMKEPSTTAEAGGITVTINGTDLVMAARNATSDSGRRRRAEKPGQQGPEPVGP